VPHPASRWKRRPLSLMHPLERPHPDVGTSPICARHLDANGWRRRAKSHRRWTGCGQAVQNSARGALWGPTRGRAVGTLLARSGQVSGQARGRLCSGRRKFSTAEYLHAGTTGRAQVLGQDGGNTPRFCGVGAQSFLAAGGDLGLPSQSHRDELLFIHSVIRVCLRSVQLRIS
jgi:hypothetical protein